jgi:hypothetical protein
MHEDACRRAPPNQRQTTPLVRGYADREGRRYTKLLGLA